VTIDVRETLTETVLLLCGVFMVYLARFLLRCKRRGVRALCDRVELRVLLAKSF
jgi:hypothetical protein